MTPGKKTQPGEPSRAEGSPATYEPLSIAQLELLLDRRRSAHARIRSVSSVPNEFASRAHAENLTVEMSDGSLVRLFVKRCGDGEEGHPDKSRRDREHLVYRRLLAGGDLPVPAFYAARSLHSDGRHELLLEHVDGWNLKYQDLGHWRTAASKLARMHGHFAARADELAGCRFLLRLDRQYFEAWASRAQVAVSAAWEDLGRALEEGLRSHGKVASLLAEQPPTLVHNDLAPKNVIAETSVSPARICFVDWELAGLGCGVLDLVHLTHGLSADEEAAMIAAYSAALAGTRLATSPAKLRGLLAACALHNTLYRLAHIETWRLGRETTERWVEHVVRLADLP